MNKNGIFLTNARVIKKHIEMCGNKEKKSIFAAFVKMKNSIIIIKAHKK